LTIRDVLLHQQKEMERVLDGPGIRRDMTLSGAGDGIRIRIITGPRRSGKTFLALRHLARFGREFGYIDLADERLSGLADPDTILAAIDSVYGKQTTLLIDGISHLPDWESFVDRLAGREYDLVLTDNTRLPLKSGPATHLTGRCSRALLFPLSFREYLGMVPEQNPQQKLAALHEYAESGGFSEPRAKKIPGRDYCASLFATVLYHDIVRKNNIRSVQALDDLARYLLTCVATEYSYQSLARAMRNTTAMTVSSYLRYLEDAFLFFSISRFSGRERQQVPANKKIYCTDNGFVTAKLSGAGSPEHRGKLYENLVAIELWKWQEQGGGSVSYWRNAQKEQVDFVIESGGTVTALIQVSADVAEKARSRKVRALLKASRDLGCENLLLLSEQEEKIEKAEWFGIKGTVRYVPLGKWLENPEHGCSKKAPDGPGQVNNPPHKSG
jgi:predicted AAA+ superfamily ATPase